MPFVQRTVEPKHLSRSRLFDDDGKPLVADEELDAVANNTLSNALRQLASLVLVANDIFVELGGQLREVSQRSEVLKGRITVVQGKVEGLDPKKVTVPESDICTFALRTKHYASKTNHDTNLFTSATRPTALQVLYESASKTPLHVMRQLDRWRRDGNRSSKYFTCTPVLGAKRRKIRSRVDIEIETSMPAAVEELRRWTSSEALGDITVHPDCPNRIVPNVTVTDVEATDGTIGSDDEGIDHKLPSPEEQLQVVALKFPAELVAVDVSGRSFDRMSSQRRSLLHGDMSARVEVDGSAIPRRKSKTRKSRSKRRNTLAGTDQKEIRDALAGDETSSPINHETEASTSGAAFRSKSTDILRSSSKKESPDNKKSHFNTLKQWGKNQYEKLMNKSSEYKSDSSKKEDSEDVNIYETVTTKRKRSVERDKKKTHERSSSVSSSEKSSISVPVSTPLSSVMNFAVKLRDTSAQRRRKKDEPHSSSGNWSASSESGRTSVASESTTTIHPKSTTSNATSMTSLHQQAPSSVNSRRRFIVNTSASSSVTSEGTLTPDIIHDLHEDGETSSVYSCDTEGYYTSFHLDSGLKTLKEEDMPCTPLHSTSAFSNSSSNNTILTAENEYELFGKGSTSTTTSSAGTVCTTLRAADSSKSLSVGPAVPERKSSLSKQSSNNTSPESSLERDCTSDKTGTVKRSPITHKASVVAEVHKQNNGDISPDSGHNTSSSPIESISSPNGIRSGSEFEFSESSDMEGAERIERIRVKTTINSSRIPSMCVITPSHSDDESIKSYSSQNKHYFPNPSKIEGINLGSKSLIRNKLNLPIDVCDNVAASPESKTTSDSDKENRNVEAEVIRPPSNKNQLINVNPQTGYATIETIEPDSCDINKNSTKIVSVDDSKAVSASTGKTFRAPSPSGGTVTVKPESPKKPSQLQPIFKASLMPLNSMFGKLKSNIVNVGLRYRKDSKSPIRPSDEFDVDSGEYVTIADVRNNNKKLQTQKLDELSYVNIVDQNLKSVLSGKKRDTEYVSLNELPCNDANSECSSMSDSLETNKRHGSKVTVNAEGQVVYNSDSLRRRKVSHTTFEPGPFVKPSTTPTQSPLPNIRTPKSVRPVSNVKHDADGSAPLTPQTSRIVIKATSPMPEILRLSEISKPLPPKGSSEEVNVQDTTNQQSPALNKDRVPPEVSHPMYQSTTFGNHPLYLPNNIYAYQDPSPDRNIETRRYLESQYYLQKGSNSISQTLPSKRTQLLLKEACPERSVTPDITRGLGRRNDFDVADRKIRYEANIMTPKPRYPNRQYSNNLLNQKLGIPVQMPQIRSQQSYATVPSVPSYSNNQNVTEITSTRDRANYYSNTCTSPQKRQYKPDTRDLMKISPIDPRNAASFKSSTPSKELKAAANLDTLLLSPKKSTMSNEELYAVIHKSKKTMNIETEIDVNKSPTPTLERNKPASNKSPETGYIGDKSKSRLSWSPSKGEYVDFNADIDNVSPINNPKSRQSWAIGQSCTDRKGNQQTSRLDFKKLLLKKSSVLSPPQKKLSAVEQLKLSKQQIQVPKTQAEMSILELSGSPRSLNNRKFNRDLPTSPKHTLDKSKQSTPKLMSPRSQWRFTSPRTDVLSSTILEDCREDESPNNSLEKQTSPPNKAASPSCSPKLEADDCNKKEIRESKSLDGSPKNEPRKTTSTYLPISQRMQARRAEFFNSGSPNTSPSRSNESQFEKTEERKCLPQPTLETAF